MINLFERHPELLSCRPAVEAAADIIVQTFKCGGKILLCGNGASNSDCEHIVTNLMKSFLRERKPDSFMQCALRTLYPDVRPDGKTEGEYFAASLHVGVPAIPLGSLASINTAYINDVSADMMFAQLVYALGKPSDVLWGLSTSGNSGNIVNAVKVAKAMGMKTIGFTGEKTSKMEALCTVTVKAPSTKGYEIQEYHEMLHHCISSIVEDKIMTEVIR